MKLPVSLLFILSSLLFLPILAGCIPPLSNVVFATQADVSGKPLNSSSTFTIDTPVIICSVGTDGLPPPSQVRVEWLYNDLSGWKPLKEETLTVAGAYFLAFRIDSPAAGWQPGEYMARLSLDGNLKSERGFAIRLDPSVTIPEIHDFQATPSNLTLGQQVSLSWNVTGASRVVISPDVGAVPAGGTKFVTPSTDTRYTINAVNSGGVASRSLDVKVAQPSLNTPDLAVEDIFREASMIYYKVVNDGSVSSKGCNAGLYMGPTPLGTSYIPPLLPGERRTLYFGTFSWTFFYDTPATVCADVDKQNNENNSGNNCLSKIIPGVRGF
jgi:hypothetical protein